MIKVTRLNGSEFWVNQDHIQFLERTPETVLSLSDGKKVTVKEAPDEVLNAIIAYKRQLTPPVLGSEQN